MVELTLTGGCIPGYAPNGANRESKSQTFWASMTERARSVEKVKLEVETSNKGSPTS